MRFSLIAAAVAGAGIAQVAATPIRIVVTSERVNVSGHHAEHSIATYMMPPPEHIHLGPAFSGKGAVVVGQGGGRPGCRMNRFRQKGIEISNAFRKALGWPLIQNFHQDGRINTHSLPVVKYKAGELPEGMVQILPVVGTPPIPINHFSPSHSMEFHPHVRPRPHHHLHHDRPFLDRLRQSLVNLGKWEGRTVAFVLGCGIGVLLRMFWVLGIVFIRMIRGPKEEAHEYTHITVFEEVEEDDNTAVPPPTYTYPVDEKVAIDVEPSKTTEETK